MTSSCEIIMTGAKRGGQVVDRTGNVFFMDPGCFETQAIDYFARPPRLSYVFITESTVCLSSHRCSCLEMALFPLSGEQMYDSSGLSSWCLKSFSKVRYRWLWTHRDILERFQCHLSNCTLFYTLIYCVLSFLDSATHKRQRNYKRMADENERRIIALMKG